MADKSKNDPQAAADGQEPYYEFEHRVLAHPTNDFDTLVHLLKGCLGSGILAMPMAFSNAGLGCGLGFTLFIGFICTYCIHMLVKSAHELYRRKNVPALSYAEVAEIAFSSGPPYLHRWAWIAKTMVNVFIIIDLFGTCSVYLVFVSTNIKQVMEVHTDIRIYIQCYILALLPPLILINLVRNLKYLAPFSMVANALMAAGMGIALYYIFIGLPVITSRPHFVDWKDFPMFFGTTIFALEAVGVVMTLENNMQTPKHFLGIIGVLNIGMALITLLYAGFGFSGYWKYGPDTKGSITLNLPQDQALARSVKLMIAGAIFLTYSLQFYVPMEIVWRYVTARYGPRNLIVEHIVRNSIIIATAVVAMAVPKLPGFISLVGALCLSTLGLIFPSIIEFATFHHEVESRLHFHYMLWKNVFFISCGLLGLLTGTYASIHDIIYSEEEA